MLRHHLPVGDVVGHLAQRVHVVGEGDQPGLDLIAGEHAEGVTHHRCARDLAKSTDMRQAGRAVAGLEDHLILGPALEPRDDLARLLERPSMRLLGEFARTRYVFLGSRSHRHFFRALTLEARYFVKLSLVKTGRSGNSAATDRCSFPSPTGGTAPS